MSISFVTVQLVLLLPRMMLWKQGTLNIWLLWLGVGKVIYFLPYYKLWLLASFRHDYYHGVTTNFPNFFLSYHRVNTRRFVVPMNGGGLSRLTCFTLSSLDDFLLLFSKKRTFVSESNLEHRWIDTSQLRPIKRNARLFSVWTARLHMAQNLVQ